MRVGELPDLLRARRPNRFDDSALDDCAKPGQLHHLAGIKGRDDVATMRVVMRVLMIRTHRLRGPQAPEHR
jgi:hypothetical protein